jgi:hypothetical protein
MAKKILFVFFFLGIAIAAKAQPGCHFKNPLCFYYTDILSYLQVLHKNQQYEKMSSLFYGPFAEQHSVGKFRSMLGEVDFGYSLKRVGIRQYSPTKWSITFERTILGTNENFKIDCEIVRDTCRVYLDRKTWNVLFP